MTTEPLKIEPLLFDSYLTMVKNSVGSNMFRNLYAKVNDEKKDIVENGDLSCAFFASSLLTIFKLTKEIHATVSGTVRDMKESGWVEINEPKLGCVIVWTESVFASGGKHRHLGFYLGNNRAVSNNTEQGFPTEHNADYRKIETLFWHPKLDQ